MVSSLILAGHGSVPVLTLYIHTWGIGISIQAGGLKAGSTNWLAESRQAPNTNNNRVVVWLLRVYFTVKAQGLGMSPRCFYL